METTTIVVTDQVADKLILTPAERKLLAEIVDLLSAQQEKLTVNVVKRRSDREFDLSFEGKIKINRTEYFMSAWLPLQAIDTLTEWTDPYLAAMTDYPAMTEQGDWSGVRDTNENSLWAIFQTFCVG